MRVPVWVLSILLLTYMAVLGWAITDLIDQGKQLAQYTGTLEQIALRLEQIEDKVDLLLQENRNAGIRQRNTEAQSGARPAR